MLVHCFDTNAKVTFQRQTQYSSSKMLQKAESNEDFISSILEHIYTKIDIRTIQKYYYFLVMCYVLCNSVFAYSEVLKAPQQYTFGMSPLSDPL